jgi:hypothetical protein
LSDDKIKRLKKCFFSIKKSHPQRFKNLDELKTRINNEIKSVSKRTLDDVFSNIIKRMDLCVVADGDHFEHLL